MWVAISSRHSVRTAILPLRWKRLIRRLCKECKQPYDCDPAVLDAALSFLGQFASPDAPAGPQVPFGPSRPQPADAPLLDRVVALAGRDPGWSPR